MKTGGPAFPGFEHYTDGKQLITGEPHGGMSLRDYLAAKAMQGLLVGGAWYPELSEDAYKLADAMLAERDKT